MARIETDPNYTSPTFSRATAATDSFKKEDVQNLAAAMSTHIHDGTGKGLAIVAAAIPDGAITSAKIADGTIQAGDLADGAVTSAKILDGTIATADLAPNAVTQIGFALGITPNATTTSTTFVDIDGNGSGNQLRVDLTTTGGDLLVWLSVQSSSSLASAVHTFGLALDGAAEVGQRGTNFAGANFQAMVTAVHRFTGVSAGAHNIRARWNVNSGTGTLGGINRSLLVLEVKR